MSTNWFSVIKKQKNTVGTVVRASVVELPKMFISQRSEKDEVSETAT